MENATKALLMAGGILVGLIVISLGVRLFVNLNKSGKTYSSAPETAAIQSLNAKFEKYIRRDDISPQEIVSIYNLKEECKGKYPYEIKLKVGTEYIYFREEKDKLDYIKDTNKKFTCNKIEYENTNGQVKEIHFTPNRI